MSELHPISEACRDPERKADVVFVHGLGGDHVLTWRHGDDEDTFWPGWLAKECDQVGVWTLSYAASPSAWFRVLKKLPLRRVPGLKGFYAHADRDTGRSMHLPDRGVEVLNGLVLDGLGQRPLIFVCHSLGGLLVKQVLRKASDKGRPDWKALCDQTAAVMFLSTPHAGSHLATVINRIGKGLRINPSLYGLKANDPHLRDLGQWYVNNMAHIQHAVYYENDDTFGLRVVDETSAQLSIGGTAVPLDEDHLSIAKPRNTDARICKDLRRLVSQVIANAAGGSTSSAATVGRISSVPASMPPELQHIVQLPSAQQPGRGSAIPCQLPRAASRFFGREDKVEALVARLGSERDTVVAGAAGMGKTALAAEALHRMLGKRPRDRLAGTPFPDGIVFVDLYQQRDQPQATWRQIADAVGGRDLLQNTTDDIRAREACRGKQLLLIVEGGEEADGGPHADGSRRPSRHTLLDPLQWEGSVLWLTRPTPTSPAADIVLDAPLSEGEADALLAHLTTGAPLPVDATVRKALAEGLGRHPLALTWAGGLLQRGGLRPERLVEELRQQPARLLHDPEDARHTLQWLFQRSVRLLDPHAHDTLAAAGLLAHAPFPLSALCAATGLTPDVQEAALRQCVQSRLLELEAEAQPERWHFGHALGHRFAAALADELPPEWRDAMLQRLMQWADRQLQAELAANAPAESLAHAQALLQACRPPEGWDELAYNLLYANMDRLDALGRLGERWAVLGIVDAWWQRIDDVHRNSAKWQREAVAILSRQGDALVEQGDLSRAQRHYDGALEIIEALAARDPENNIWQRDLSVIHIKLGDVLQAQGDFVGAERRCETGLAIREVLTTRDPENAVLQRDLAVAHGKLGDVLQVQAELAGAKRRYEAAFEIIEALAARDPENYLLQRDLSVSHNKLGDTLQAQGDLAEAQRRYEAGLEISAALARRDPRHASWQRDWSVSFEKLGNVLKAQGDLSEAQRHYEAGLQIREALAARDPENAGWQRDLSVLQERLGDVLHAQGDLESAQRLYEAAHEIRVALVACDPEHAGWQHDLSLSFEKLGNALQAQGDLAGAQRRYEAGLGIREALAARDPDNAGWQRDLMVSYSKLGAVCAAQGDTAGQRAHWMRAQGIVEALVQRWPEHPQFRKDLATLDSAIASLDA